MNTKLRAEAKTNFEKDLFKLMNNAVSGKAMENVRKKRYVKPVTTNRKGFSKGLLTIGINKVKVQMDKPVYLGLSTLEISKTLTYEFLHHFYLKNNIFYFKKTCLEVSILYRQLYTLKVL